MGDNLARPVIFDEAGRKLAVSMQNESRPLNMIELFRIRWLILITQITFCKRVDPQCVSDGVVTVPLETYENDVDSPQI